MEDLLYRFNPWWDGTFESPGIPRDDYLSRLLKLKNRKDIILITGLRRVGKTTLMHQLIHKLLEAVDSKHIFYVSLDNIALKDRSILEIVDIFRRINELKHDEFVYLFLDEVHFKKDYELQLKNLYDMGNVKIYASGSSSLDIIMKSPYLTGRQRIVRMAPLNFIEFLKFTSREIGKADQHLFPAAAEDYIRTGGMPEYVLTKDLNILQSIIYSILYRDIAGRYEIRNRESLFDILALLAQSVGSPMSLRKISRVLGIPIETVNRTLELFVEANLIHLVEREGKLSERKA
ncbi:MAG: ATP-binding protein, partial [Thermoplasmata archaeon]|nr:ATP-binding protein [Thermoplasmata archaeon]